MLTNVFVQKLNLQNSQKLDILIKIKKLSELSERQTFDPYIWATKILDSIFRSYKDLYFFH